MDRFHPFLIRFCHSIKFLSICKNSVKEPIHLEWIFHLLYEGIIQKNYWPLRSHLFLKRPFFLAPMHLFTRRTCVIFEHLSWNRNFTTVYHRVKVLRGKCQHKFGISWLLQIWVIILTWLERKSWKNIWECFIVEMSPNICIPFSQRNLTVWGGGSGDRRIKPNTTSLNSFVCLEQCPVKIKQYCC